MMLVGSNRGHAVQWSWEVIESSKPYVVSGM